VLQGKASTYVAVDIFLPLSNGELNRISIVPDHARLKGGEQKHGEKQNRGNYIL